MLLEQITCRLFTAMLKKGTCERLSWGSHLHPEVWYLPHFPVIRMDKTTTKVHIVFYCSAKTDGVSLNDAIRVGSKLQKDLFNVFIRSGGTLSL